MNQLKVKDIKNFNIKATGIFQMSMRLISMLMLCLISYSVKAQSDFEDAFRHPSDYAKPWVYWYWNNGNVTKEGIIADMKGFNDVGIGGVNFLDIGLWPQGAVTYRSKEWYDLVKVALSEARKYGIKVNLTSPGWSSSGGPWITPEMSMKQLTWMELRVNDKNNTQIILDKPHINLDYYKDIAILAFPSPKGDNWLFKDLNPQILDTTGIEIPNAKNLFDGNLNSTASLPAKFDIVLNKDVEVSSIFIRPNRMNSLNATLLVWNEELGEFKKLAEFKGVDSGPLVEQIGDASFPKTRARKFRILMNPGPVKELYLSGGYRINHWGAKSGLGIYDLKIPTDDFLKFNNAKEEDIIPMEDIHILTDKLSPDGKLNWRVPKGEWTIIRMGYTTNGIKIYPPPVGGDGLECDKLSKDGTSFNYQFAIKPVLDKMGPDLSKVVECQHIDSYEAGWQNWTGGFEDEFKERCGYDIIKYLPVVTGRVVEDQAVSEKFLWDFRHTISDMFIENHLGGAAKAGREDGLLFSNEPINYPADGLKAGSMVDYPMCEFWIPFTKPRENRMKFQQIFAGRINGKKILGAEAFTSDPPYVRWNMHPYSLKATGDYIYCSGITRFTLHVSSHQPYVGEHLAPGMTAGSLGVHFDRGNTWWKHGAKEYIEYLTRTQSMLQQGEHLADALYFIGNEIPFNDRWIEEWGLKKYEPELPYGYDFDACSEDVLVKLKTRDNLLELPFGKNYKYLVLSKYGWITTSLLKKVLELIKSGATVIGSPVGYHSPSLSDDMRHGQTERNNIIREIWGSSPDKQGERNVGKGRIIWGSDFQTILSKDNLIPDFSYKTEDSLLINTTHRYTEKEEIYFVANGKQIEGWATCRFRVKDKVPQFYNAHKGTIEPCKMYKQKGDYTEIPIFFDPAGSIFVVFKNVEKVQNSIVSVSHNGVDITRIGKSVIDFSESDDKALVWEPGTYEIIKANGNRQNLSVSNIPTPIEFTRPWQLHFPAGWGAPEKIEFPKLISYSEHLNEGIKYFSGTVTYQTTVNVPQKMFEKNRKIYLDLGRVEVIAEVKINDKVLGTYWKPPFTLDVTSAIIAGNNKVEITVTNLWPNRMIGDEQHPLDFSLDEGWPEWVLKNEPRPEPRRMTFTPLRVWNKNETLLPSGLLGPVTLKSAELVKIDDDY